MGAIDSYTAGRRLVLTPEPEHTEGFRQKGREGEARSSPTGKPPPAPACPLVADPGPRPWKTMPCELSPLHCHSCEKEVLGGGGGCSWGGGVMNSLSGVVCVHNMLLTSSLQKCASVVSCLKVEMETERFYE